MEKIKYCLKIFFILFKESILPFIYMLILGFLSAMIITMDSLVAKILLLILVIAFFVFMCILISKGFGEKQYKALITSNIRRNKNNKEDIDKYCKPENEYKFYNGILFGITISLIMYVLLIIRIFAGARVGLEAAIKLISLIYSSVLTLFGATTSVFYLFPMSLITILSCTFGYYIGVKKIMRQQEKLQKTHDEIYGKGN
jgi:Ca2+/Na+ antiporter